MTLRTMKILLVFRRGSFLLPGRLQQHHGLQFKLRIRAARSDDGFHVSGESRHVARHKHAAAAHAFYWSIITREAITMLLCWWGGFAWLGRLRGTRGFPSSQARSDRGFRVEFADVAGHVPGRGGEWFLMWQSRTWNGQDAAFRMFTVVGVVLLLVAQPDAERPALAI